MELFGGFFVFWIMAVVLGLAATGFCLWGIIDAATMPDHAWVRSGENKTLWIALQAVGLFVCAGFVLTIVYFTSIRPKVLPYR